MSTVKDLQSILLTPLPSTNSNLHFALARVALLLDESRSSEWYPDLPRRKKMPEPRKEKTPK